MEWLVIILSFTTGLFLFNWILEMKAHDRTKRFKEIYKNQCDRLVEQSWKNLQDKRHYRAGLINIKIDTNDEEAKKIAKAYLDSKPLPF